ncbi:MAG: CDP-alcohol phosphatidyltransferase family protein [Planctomycetaceae bacterium]
MARVSHSLLDRWLSVPLKRLYPRLGIPRWFPPEGIVLAGHACAIAAAVGFACSSKWWWGGVLAAIGVAANHFADLIDGTHARTTNQCRNGGELLDHLTDPLSFSYWMIGIGIAAGAPLWGTAAVVGIYATAVLTNIRAKITGEFALAAFGPTEFKTLLALFGLTMTAATGGLFVPLAPATIAFWFLAPLVIVGIVQLAAQLVSSVRQVNAAAVEADETEWVMDGGAQAPRAPRPLAESESLVLLDAQRGRTADSRSPHRNDVPV